MKKNLLGLLAALFVFALLLPVVGRATNNVYAILYDDGTLVFQNGNTPESGRTATNTYAVDLTAVYTYDSRAPWYDERTSVRVVSFATRVSPVSTAYWFDDCLHLERVDNIQNLDTASVTDMNHMFCGCLWLTELDVSHFNTANVTDMSYTFSGCWRLPTLDVSRFDTANVTNMEYTFAYCKALTALDVSHFNTANVTTMYGMFYDCETLTELDVSRFDTAKVRHM
ncbi:MAG: BspA family leucine-rich repeat surface protein, partial [Oscillibacter sp.]|nr:BspA family leucine-rich repeat surface protein [Oscillibacter sp.]